MASDSRLPSPVSPDALPQAAKPYQADISTDSRCPPQRQTQVQSQTSPPTHQHLGQRSGPSYHDQPRHYHSMMSVSNPSGIHPSQNMRVAYEGSVLGTNGSPDMKIASLPTSNGSGYKLLNSLQNPPTYSSKFPSQLKEGPLKSNAHYHSSSDYGLYESTDSPPLQQSVELELELDPAMDEFQDDSRFQLGGDTLHDTHAIARAATEVRTDDTNYDSVGSMNFQGARRPSIATTVSAPTSGSFVDIDDATAENPSGDQYPLPAQSPRDSIRPSAAAPPNISYQDSIRTPNQASSLFDARNSGAFGTSQDLNRPVLPCSDLAAKLSGYSLASSASTLGFNSNSQSFSTSGSRSAAMHRSLWSSVGDIPYMDLATEKTESFGDKMLSEYFFQSQDDPTCDMLSIGSSAYSSASSSALERYRFSEQELSHFDPTQSDRLGPFQLQKVLGKGTSAIVRAAKHLDTGFEVAVKILTKHTEPVDGSSQPAEFNDSTDAAPAQRNLMVKIRRETAILKLFDHPNVLKLFDVFETNQYAFLVLERASRGELFELITQQGRLSVSMAKLLLSQLVQALRHCHRLGVAHRDVKPENVLLDAYFVAKLCDFGMAKSFAQVNAHGTSQARTPTSDHGEPLLTTACGSPHYASPELLRGLPYDGCKSDTWSLGIVAYALITGSLPFDHPRLTTLFQLIIKGEFYMPDFVPNDYAALVRAMLDPNPQTRITLDDIPSHPAFGSATNQLGYLFATPTSAAEAAILISSPEFPFNTLRPEPEWQAAILANPKIVAAARMRARGNLGTSIHSLGDRSDTFSTQGSLDQDPSNYSDRLDQYSYSRADRDDGDWENLSSVGDGHATSRSLRFNERRRSSVDDESDDHSSERCNRISSYSDSDQDVSQDEYDSDADSDSVENDDIVQIGQPQLVPIRRTTRYGTLIPQIDQARSPDLCNIKTVSISPQISQRRTPWYGSPMTRPSTLPQRGVSPINSTPGSQFLRVKRSQGSAGLPPTVPSSLPSELSAYTKQCSAARTLTFCEQITRDSNCNRVERGAQPSTQSTQVSPKDLTGRKTSPFDLSDTARPPEKSQTQDEQFDELNNQSPKAGRARAWSCDVDAPFVSPPRADQIRASRYTTPTTETRGVFEQPIHSDLVSSNSVASHKSKPRMSNVSLHYEQRTPSPAESFVLQTTNLYSLAPPLRTRQATSTAQRTPSISSSSSSSSASPYSVRPVDASPLLIRASSALTDVPADLTQRPRGSPHSSAAGENYQAASPLVSGRSGPTASRVPASAPRHNTTPQVALRRYTSLDIKPVATVGVGIGVGMSPDHPQRDSLRVDAGSEERDIKPTKVASSRVLLFSPIQERTGGSGVESTRPPQSSSAVLNPVVNEQSDSVHALSLMSPTPCDEPVLATTLSNAGNAVSATASSNPHYSASDDKNQHLDANMPAPIPLPLPDIMSRRDSLVSRHSNGPSEYPTVPTPSEQRDDTEAWWFSPALAIDELTVLDLAALGWGTPSEIRNGILEWHRLLYDFELQQIRARGQADEKCDTPNLPKRESRRSSASPFYSPLPTMPFTIVRGKGANGATASTITSTRPTIASTLVPNSANFDVTSTTFADLASPIRSDLTATTQRADLPDTHFTSNVKASPGQRLSQRNGASPPSRTRQLTLGRPMRAETQGLPTRSALSSRTSLASPAIPDALKSAPRVVFYYYLLLKRKRRRLRQLCKISPRLPPVSPSSAAKSLTLARVVVKEEEREEVDAEDDRGACTYTNEPRADAAQMSRPVPSLTPSLLPSSAYHFPQERFAEIDTVDQMPGFFASTGITPCLRPLTVGRTAIPPLQIPHQPTKESSELDVLSHSSGHEETSVQSISQPYVYSHQHIPSMHSHYSEILNSSISEPDQPSDPKSDLVLVPGVWDVSPRENAKKIRWDQSLQASTADRVDSDGVLTESQATTSEHMYPPGASQSQWHTSSIIPESTRTHNPHVGVTPPYEGEYHVYSSEQKFVSSPPPSARECVLKSHRSPMYAAFAREERGDTADDLHKEAESSDEDALHR